MTDKDMVRLHNLRKRLWDRIKMQADDVELAALIQTINDTTDRIIHERANPPRTAPPK